MDQLCVKDDGTKLIEAPGYQIEDLQKYIKQTCLMDKCCFLDDAIDVEKICKSFLALLQNELNLDEVTSLFVAVSMVYFIDATPENMEWRTHLLHTTFRYVDTLNPIHLHLATKRLWNGLKLDGIDTVLNSYILNMLTICHPIAIASETGRAIAICLTWSILSHITGTEIEMYCFREFSEVTKMLNRIKDENLQEDSTQIVFILVQIIGFLVNSIVFGHNEDLKKAGYRKYFIYKRRDLENLKIWSEHLCSTLKVSVSKTNNYWDVRMSIREYLNANITGALEDKLLDLKSTAIIK